MVFSMLPNICFCGVNIVSTTYEPHGSGDKANLLNLPNENGLKVWGC